MATTVVFIHGWSVTHTDTYGGLPERLGAEFGETLQLHDIWLGRYVSFRDEVRMEDLSRALEHAIRRELAGPLHRRERFVFITHSTGGPLARDWWWRYYASKRERPTCPMSHLIMLAPANFGSALVQLGKSRVGRLFAASKGVEPGQGVLDWLEHGSTEAWELNEAWIRGRFGRWAPDNVFPFVLTGQTIDRTVYSHLNSYTGELGSDGVIRVPSANLNARLLRLVQSAPSEGGGPDSAAQLVIEGRGVVRAPATAFLLISGASHSGATKGILGAVRPEVGGQGAEVVGAIQRCMAVSTTQEYNELAEAFRLESQVVYGRERAEVEEIPVLPDREYVHDQMSLTIIRIRDMGDHPVSDFDLELTGVNDSPDLLPVGALKDRQKNLRSSHVLTLYLNYDLIAGSSEVRHEGREKMRVLRSERRGIQTLGLRVKPRPQEGFVHYLTCGIRANRKVLGAVLAPNETTMIDIRLRRIVHEGVFRMASASEGRRPFRDDSPDKLLEGEI